jgi:ATP-dependent protease ClpP protease subunit
MKKPWDIRMVAGGNAEIRLYGPILERQPMNFWTGEPVKGLFVTQEGFLEALEEIKSAGRITVRVNSPGGDVATGQSIYTNLKSLPGRKVGIVDGLAASAASLILMAMDEIRMPAGSRLMIHEGALMLWDVMFYEDLMKAAGALSAINVAAAETYHNKTGIPVSEIEAMMKAETWMTGREAVERGFADKLMFDEGAPGIQLSADRQFILSGDQRWKADAFSNIPEDVPVKSPRFSFAGWNSSASHMSAGDVPPDEEDDDEIGGLEDMFKTVEEMIQAYPEFCTRLRDEAQSNGVELGARQERERIKAIEEIAAGVGDPKLVGDAKFGDKPLDAGQLAMAALRKQSAMGAQFLEKLGNDAKNSGAAAVGSAPNAGWEEKEEEQRAAMAAAIAKFAGGRK